VKCKTHSPLAKAMVTDAAKEHKKEKEEEEEKCKKIKYKNKRKKMNKSSNQLKKGTDLLTSPRKKQYSCLCWASSRTAKNYACSTHIDSSPSGTSTLCFTDI